MPRFVAAAGAVLAVTALSVVVPGNAAETTPKVLAGYVMPDTETWELTAAADDYAYRIFVARPGGDPPEGGFPVLYVLDGNAMFAGFAEARRIQEKASPGLARSIIVGIGYATEQPYDVRRLYDFTPPSPTPPPAAQARLANYRTGGHEQFADFLLTRLRLEVAKRYKVNPHRQALFGHSLGGLFALHVLYTRPHAFHAIVAASPSMWWDPSILAEERAFVQELSQGELKEQVSRVLLLAGEFEESASNVWDSEALAERLEPLSAFGLRTRFELFEDETHVSVPSRAITTSLRFAFSWP